MNSFTFMFYLSAALAIWEYRYHKTSFYRTLALELRHLI